MRAPFQEGDFPGPVKYGYLNVGVVEQGPLGAARPHGLLPLPAPERATSSRPARSPSCPRRASRASRPRRHGRDRRERAVGRGPLVGDRVAVVGAGMVGCCVARAPRPASRRCEVTSSTPNPAAPRSPRARRRVRGTRGRRRRLATWSCTPAPRPRGSQRRSTCSRRTARSSSSAGTATPRSSCRWAALPLGPPRHPRQPGRDGPAARIGAARRPSGSGWPSSCSRDPAFDALVTGKSASSELPEVMAAAGRGKSVRALSTPIASTGEYPLFSVTVRDHMMVAHSFARRGVRARTAAARRDVRRRRDVPQRGARRRQHRRRHRARRRAAPRRRSANSTTATSTTNPRSPASTPRPRRSRR